MTYLTYDEYQALGGTLDETAFNLRLRRASGIITNATFGRIKEPKNVNFDDFPPVFEGMARANGTYTSTQLISSAIGSEQKWRIACRGYVEFVINTSTTGFASDILYIDGKLVDTMYEAKPTATYKGYVEKEIMLQSQFGTTFTLIKFTFAETEIPAEAKELCRDLIEFLDKNNELENAQSVSQSAGGVSESVSSLSREERAEHIDNMVRDYLAGVKTANGVSLLYRGCRG